VKIKAILVKDVLFTDHNGKAVHAKKDTSITVDPSEQVALIEGVHVDIQSDEYLLNS
jgi:hypothetical protein